MDAETEYTGELKGLYASLTATQTSEHQWPPPCTKKVFNLAMIKEEQVQRGKVKDSFVRMTITGKLDDILHVKTPVELNGIFSGVQPNKRKVVLMEGAPGCGKSTLANDISQKWGKDELFTEFKAVVLVRLRDPVVRKAQSIADLFPLGENSTTQRAEESMRTSKFQDVLFILDGWDELPNKLRKESIFHKLIQEDKAKQNGLDNSAVIVTSRPVASGDLQRIVSSRIEILGFKPDQLNEYFHECLEGDSKAVNTLLEQIEENPEIAGTCRLPLNASILVHLFKNNIDKNLPTSQYGIYSLLVCTCISRHLKERTRHEDLSLKTLDQLMDTDVVKEPFRFLCDLAYKGVMKDEITFSSLPDTTNTLSILNGVESFIKCDHKVKSYNFIHLSIQELLGAFFMAKWLQPNEQVAQFNELFDKPRFNAVFQFYSAMTKLQTPGITDIITRVAEQCSEQSAEDDVKILLVALLHCLNAAQDPLLCKLVLKHLQHGLNLGHITLNPTNCLCIGYFLSCACNISTETSEFKAKIFNCNIGNDGCKYLVKGMQKCLTTSDHATTKLYMDLKWSNIEKEGSMELSKLLRYDCISGLNLNGNEDLSDQGTLHITENLKTNTSLTELQLYTCGLTAEGVGYIAEALKINGCLKTLNLGGNGVYDEGVKHLASALRENHDLKSLELSSCGMTDQGLKHITDSLQCNKSLEELKLYNFQNQKHLNSITVDGDGMDCLIDTIGKTSALQSLVLPKEFEKSLSDIQKDVNEERKCQNLAGIIKVEVKGQTLNTIRGIEESDDEAEERQPNETDLSELHNIIQPGMEEELETIIIRERLDQELEVEIKPELKSMYFAQRKGFRGVDVCAETALVVTNTPKNCMYIWEGYGLTLRVPKNCLPPGLEQCTINIKASLSGKYKFPDNSHPVSAIFWIRCEPSCRFRLPISVKIQHCARRNDVSKLSFVKAHCSQEDLPYHFKNLQGSHFHTESSHGTIELDSFSGVCITKEGSEDDEYVASLFYLNHTMFKYEIHLVVTCDTETHLTVMEKHYHKWNKNFVLSSQQQIEFESEKIKPEIITGDTDLKGWKITYMKIPAEISKKSVDFYKPGKLIPFCQLSADFESGAKKKITPSLSCHVKLNGTKESNMFAFRPPPPLSSLHAKIKSKKERLRKRTQSTYVRRPRAKRPKKAASFEQVTKTSDEESEELEMEEQMKPARKKQKTTESIESSSTSNQRSVISDDITDNKNESCEIEKQSMEIEERDAPARTRIRKERIQSGEVAGQLSRHDLITVQDEVWCARCKWMNIGLHLDLIKSDLDAIKEKFGSDPDKCFLEMLTQWLKKVDPRPTWHVIVAALEKPDVGCQDLAEELKIKFISETSIPKLDEIASDGHSREELEIKLKREYGVLRNKFFDTLEDNKLSVARLARYLRDAITGRHRLEKIEDVEDFITERSSFHDYQLLKFMIDSFGAERDKLNIQEYEKKVSEYAQRQIHECSSIIEGVSSSNGDSSSKVCIKLDSTHYHQCTLKTIKTFQHQLHIILGISEYAHKLTSLHMERSSLFITLTVYQEVIFPLTAKQKADLRNLGVIELKYRDHKFESEAETLLTTEDQPCTKDKKPGSVKLEGWKNGRNGSATARSKLHAAPVEASSPVDSISRTKVVETYINTGTVKPVSTPNTLDFPTLRNLTLIEWTNEEGVKRTLRVKQSMWHLWKEIGLLLGIDMGDLNAWETVHMKDPRNCINEVLYYWLEGPSETYPASWEGLYQLLEDIELKQVVIELKKVLDSYKH